MAIRNIGLGSSVGPERQEMSQTLESAGASDPIRLKGPLSVQLTGTATAITARVERSTQNPTGTPNWAPAETETFSGNLAEGIAARAYEEPVAAYWRVNVTALTGGNVSVSIIGEQTK